MILGEFRAWLNDLAGPIESSPPSAEPVDLHTLVAQFTALRQEVNLQTRAVRQQQEQTAQTLEQFAECQRLLEAALETTPADTPQQGDAQNDALVMALIDVADTQQRAAAETARVAQTVKTMLKQIAAPKEQPPARWNILGRLFGAGRRAEVARGGDLEETGLERLHQTVEAAASGLALGLQRIERALNRQGLEPIPALGQPFDPELMEAVEAASDSGRPAGEVVGEIRRGYCRDGRVLRFAQVRVAR